MEKKGYIQSYTGSGKGKSTSAFGLTFRALGRDWRILLVQFLKGDDTTDENYGEIVSCKKFQEQITVIQSGRKKIVMENNKDEEDKRQAFITWNKMVAELYQGKASSEQLITGDYEGGFYTKYTPYDLLILDEILVALNLGLITQKSFFEFISKIKEDMPNLEIVLTGRMWSEPLFDKIKDISNLMSDIRCEKHYFQKTCKVCKREFEYRSVFCPNCGNPLETINARPGIEM
jgi:cob(I)alamin adenosyltransferase